jgi:hypothetical protein
MDPRRARSAVALFVISVALAAANLFWTAHEVNSVRAQFAATDQVARKAGAAVEHKLCTSFGRLGALKPPAGNPAANPSRAYLQLQHLRLDELGTDLGCPRGG